VTAVLVEPTPFVAGGSRWAVLGLARFEGTRMLRHPVFWLGALGGLVLFGFDVNRGLPVLNRLSVNLAWAMAPIGCVVALLAGWAVLRAVGRSDGDPPTTMPLGMAQRSAGIVTGLTLPAAAASLLQIVLVAALMLMHPVTSIVWAEVMAGPLFVLLAGSMAVAITRLFPHPATPLFAVIGVVGSTIVFTWIAQMAPNFQSSLGERNGIEWLAPLAWPQDIIPYEIAFRPAWTHLGFLFGLTLLAAGLAMVGRWPTGWILAASGLVVAVTMGSLQFGPIGESRRMVAIGRLVGDEAELECELRSGVTLCAMPGYGGWIDEWALAIAPVLEAVPPQTRAAIEVRQYPVHNAFLLQEPPGLDPGMPEWWWIVPAYHDLERRPRTVPVESVWAPDYMSSFLAAALARELIGCTPFCAGEAQMVVETWLSSHDPQIREIVVENLAQEGVSVSQCMVATLWERPASGELIRQNWSVLTDPATTYRQAGSILGIEVPEGYGPDGGFEHGCP
jgi:hypothetical protein